MKRILSFLAVFCLAVPAFATANITLTSAQVSANGTSWTATLTGGTGTGYTISSSAGFTISCGGLRHTITGQSIAGTTLTLTLGFPIGSGWTTPTFTTTTGTTISDSGGNTSQAQSSVAFTNNSTTTVTVYASSNTAFGLFGIFPAAVTSGGRHLIFGNSSTMGYAFSFTGTDLAIIGQPQVTGALSVDVGNTGSFTTSTYGPSSALGAGAAAMPIATGLSDAAHEIKVRALNAYYDQGDIATAGQVLGTVLVVGASPAINVADNGAWGTENFLDSAPFTSVVTGTDTRGWMDKTTTSTTTINSHLGYEFNPGGNIRFASDSSSIAIYTYQNSQTYALYQDGVQVGSDTVAASGGALARLLLGSGLNTASVHQYTIGRTTLASGSATNVFYVELNGGGIAAVGHNRPFTYYEYGDSKVDQTHANYITDCRDGPFYLSALYAGGWAAWCTTGSGQKVSNYFRDNTDLVPYYADMVICSPSVNDCIPGTNWTTFQNDYQTMLSRIRTRIASPTKYILAEQPTPSTNFQDANTYRASAATAIQAAIAALADPYIIYVPTNGWISPQDTTTSPDGTHYNAVGYAQYRNRENPLYATTAITLTPTGVSGSTYTVTISTGATFTTGQTVTLSDGGDGGTFTPSVGSPGTSSVTVTPTATSTSFTFTYAPASGGTKTITPTSNQAGWRMPGVATFNGTLSAERRTATGLLLSSRR